MKFAELCFRRFWTKSHSLRRQVQRIAESTRELTDLGFEIPKYARRMLKQLDRGEMSFITHIEGLQDTLREMQRDANRVSISILTTAWVVVVGLLMLIYHPPGWERYRGFFFGVVVVLGVGLLWKIWFSNRFRR